jgi:aminoglycoside phosphotransferase (APT) family kinase protein
MPEQTPPITVVHDPADVTAAWLEGVLGRRINSFERTEAVSVWGAHVLVVAQVEGESAPLNLRVKLGSATIFGRGEVDYYLRAFVGLAEAPLVRCHYAAADESHYVLLLDDLTDTHCNQDDVPVTEAYGRALVESIAQLHAHRWALPPPDAASIEASLSEARAGLPVMLDAMKESFSAAERDMVREVFDTLPRALARRAQDAAGYSWVHGDLNPGNILAPRSGPGQVLLLDYQPFLQPPPSTGLAMYDLAYAMALWWPEADRRTWATALVEHWHAQLVSRGAGYASAERLREDWRLCVAQALMVPAARCSEPGAVTDLRWLWQMHLRRALAALADARSQAASQGGPVQALGDA